MFSAKLFETSDCRFGQVALGRGAAAALKNAASRKAIQIDAALAVYAIGADAVGHRHKGLRDVMGKIQQLRRGQIELVAESVEIAASPAGTAGCRIIDAGHFRVKLLI